MVSHVVNLDRRPERWQYVRDHLYMMGISPIRFSAIDTKPGWHGCRQSHLDILEMTPANEIITIYEDDIKFLQPWSVAFDAMNQLPKNWDCLYLGASPKEPQERCSKNLFRVKNAHVTHAIVWNKRHDGAIDYILSHKSDIRKWDDYLATVIQPKFNCFLTYPMVVTQTQFKSDTCTRSDVSTIEKFYNKYCK